MYQNNAKRRIAHKKETETVKAFWDARYIFLIVGIIILIFSLK